MAKTVDSARAEQDARSRFADLATPPPADDPTGGRYPDAVRRARLIAASDSLADAVIAHLAALGVTATADQVRVDPAGDGRQVMAIACEFAGRPAVVPLVPGSTTLRAYAPGTAIALDGPALATVELPLTALQDDRWVGAAAIAEALAEQLR